MLKRFAHDLKSIREKKKIPLIEISNETKLHISIFEKMEKGDFTFQPQTYIRAFLKQYAKYLELDENEVIHDYNLAKSGNYHPRTKPEIEEGKGTIDTDDKFADTFEEVPDKIKKDKKENESKEVSIKDEDKSEEINLLETKTKRKEMIETVSYDQKTEGRGLVKSDSPVISLRVLKNIGWTLLILLILVGVYFLITELIINDSSTKKMEIVRQNFDDVVKESERRLLGKRSEEEIADSIRKARELEASLLEETGDSLKLEITSLKNGSITVITDSLKTEKAEYGSNELGLWKARKFFVISSNNTSSFMAVLNGDTLKFTDKVLRGVKLTKNGIVK
ncbi:helix-turn-helix domain-containing protein [Bacteroidota bacterium]